MYAKYTALRDAKGMTDNAVAEATGITQSTIYDWKKRAEKNPKAGMTMENMIAIADYFGVSLDYFVEREDKA